MVLELGLGSLGRTRNRTGLTLRPKQWYRQDAPCHHRRVRFGWTDSHFRTKMQIADSVQERGGQSKAFVPAEVFVLVLRQSLKQNKGLVEGNRADAIRK